MGIKRFLSLATIMAFACILSSCSVLKPGRYSRDDKKISELRFQEIIDALDKKDSEELKKMFSPQVLKEANDIDQGIQYLMDFYKGKIQSEKGAYQVYDTNSHGVKTSELKGFYRVTTDEDSYIVFFIDQIVDTKNPDNVGLYMLQIIKESDREKEFDWGNKTKCAGVYLPDTAK